MVELIIIIIVCFFSQLKAQSVDSTSEDGKIRRDWFQWQSVHRFQASNRKDANTQASEE